MNTELLLSLKGVEVKFPSKNGWINIVESVSFDMKAGETLCLLGESGSGKSMVALSIARLLPHNAIIQGKISYLGKELLSQPEKKIQHIRGKDIAIIFEQPMGCLNPMMIIGKQIAEALKSNKEIAGGRLGIRKEVERRMEEVGIPSQRYSDYPHELSGGMQQRVMIAMALAGSPKLLIADEPTTALDLTIQRKILDLLNDLKRRYGTSIPIITHDLGVAAEMADSVAVMYAGRSLEHASVTSFFTQPAHPYSHDLLNIVTENKLQPIPGNVSNLLEPPAGCPYHPRCRNATAQCRISFPSISVFHRRMVRCHNALCH